MRTSRFFSLKSIITRFGVHGTRLFVVVTSEVPVGPIAHLVRTLLEPWRRLERLIQARARTIDVACRRSFVTVVEMVVAGITVKTFVSIRISSFWSRSTFWRFDPLTFWSWRVTSCWSC